MSHITVVLQGAIIYGVTWLLWRLLHHSILTSPLHNVPGPPSASFWTGNWKQILSRHGWDFQRDLAKSYGPVVRLTALLGAPQLFVFDPKALHNVVVKDQQIYEETSSFLATNRLVFGEGLLATVGDHHKRQRKMLNPVFSINHMRQLLPVFYEVAHKLRRSLTTRLSDGPQEIDMLRWMTRTALELIGQGGLGHSFDTLEGDESHPVETAMRSLGTSAFDMVLIRVTLPFLVKVGPAWFRRRIVEMIPDRRIQRSRNISDVLHNMSKKILDSKRVALDRGEEAVLQQVGAGKDVMSILLKENMAISEADRLPDSELLGHMTYVSS